MRVLVSFPATLLASYVVDETAFDAGAVTVTVTNSAGTVVSTGSATMVSAGQYSYALPAQSVLGPLTAVWAGAATVTTYPEIVGAPLFSLADLRVSDPSFADQSKWPTGLLAAARDAVTDEFARITGRSFIPRGNSFTAPINATGRLLLPDVDVQSIVSASLDGTTIDVSTLTADPVGVVEGVPTPVVSVWASVWSGALDSLVSSPGIFTVTYVYGFRQVPADVYRAAIQRGRYLLSSVNSGIPDRATSFQAVEGGTFTLATPGAGPWQTGIPDVDAVLARYTIRSKGVAAA